MTAAPVLHGRDGELHRLGELLHRARSGAGAALVVLGEAGMGKSALLASLPVEDALALDVRGIHAERTLAFGGLHRLLSPVVSGSSALAAELRLAMGGAPLSLRCGVHDLLVRLSAARPVVCRVDDAQWLDPESSAVLGFVARRLSGHAVFMVLASRSELGDALAGTSRLSLAPLPDDACERVLRDRIVTEVPAGLRAVLTDLAGGNPLDLVALAGALTPEQLAGRAPLPDELPEGPRRADCAARLAALPARARRLLLCAVAESTVDPLALGPVDEVVAAGLLRLDGTVVRRPSKVIRSTLYALASAADRRAAHTMLAAAVDGPQRLWHRAMAEPGSPFADDLALAAADAPSPAAAATLLERAAALTVDSGLRASRMLAAARQAWQAGRPGRARVLLSRAGGADDGEIALLHGEMELRDGEPAVATHELATAATRLADPAAAASALVLAGEARRLSGDLPGYQAMARALPAGATEMATAHFTGLAATFDGRHADAAGYLRRVVELGEASAGVAEALWAAEAAFALGRGEKAYDCASAAVSRARLSGRESTLPWALVQLSLAAIVLDRHPAARAASTEGLATAAAAAQRNTWVEHLSLLGLSAALRGDRGTALSTLDTAAPGIAGRGLGRPCAIASWAHACLDLADDRPADALGRLEAMAAGVSGAQPAIQVLATPQLVEAAVLVEQPARAERALHTFDAWVSAGGSDAWLALSHCCHGLLATDPTEAERHFAGAITLHRTAGAAMELARTQMAYAHRLRRHRRTRAARDLFRDALRVFDSAGAPRWADRARAGLRATGEAVQAPDVEPTRRRAPSIAGLTPQQAEISRLVAVGETNKEIARRLVISHRTVDHHLRNIFTTLGVRSRVELARRVAGL
ncbi:LuxR family transcriptional regulator [Actinophytocola sp.]|uniref:helix-turn-helix transcriptional regulator n=1 Tax=Actinophytocola sp. TaxID=1872138 RepID=UPI0025C5159F|nr:LuxR family transcriptional regulator [Actinophytocola sp.]